MENKDLIETCERVFNLFNGEEAHLTEGLAAVTNEPYFNSVSDFLGKQKGKDLSQSCLDCWDRITCVAFTYGFVMASMLNPNSKISLKGIQKTGAAIRKAGVFRP